MDKLITRENLAIIKTSAAGAVASTRYHSCTDVHIATRALLEDVIFPMADRCEELLERVAFLERVAEDLSDNFCIMEVTESIYKSRAYNFKHSHIGETWIVCNGERVSKVEDAPELAQYLREREAGK